MHLYHQQAQWHECLMCFEDLNKLVSAAQLINNYPLCLSCLKKFEITDHTILFHHYPLRILYNYNDFFQSLLYQYKGLYDLALKDAFLCMYHDELSHLYKNYTIVVAPSSSSSNQLRGFMPMQQIALTINKNVFVGLYKKEDYKQSDLSFEERKQVKDKIGIRNKELLKGKKVLILDDVMTSSSTMETCLKLVESCLPSRIEMLVLSSSHW